MNRRVSKPSANYWRPALFGLSVIFLTFGVGGIWAFTAPLASAVVAQGTVSIKDNIKVVQHYEGGIIRKILVEEGSRVHQGQSLFKLEATEAKAQYDVLSNQLVVGRLKAARLAAEINGSSSMTIPNGIATRKDNPDVISAINDAEALFRSRMVSLNGQIDILNSQIEQKKSEISGLSEQLEAAKNQHRFVVEERNDLAALLAKKLVARSQVLALDRESARLEGVIGQTEADISKAQSEIGAAKLQIIQLTQKMREQDSSDLTDVRAKISDTLDKLAVAKDVLNRVDIVAPVGGYVQNVQVSTIGAVIKPGEPLLDIVPMHADLIINAQISPVDIDDVRVGMKAEVRLPAFKNRDLPAIQGTVTSVSHDRLTDASSKQSYFLAQIQVAGPNIPEIVSKKLTAGMPATVLIPTTQRTVAEYLLNPLTNIMATSMREE